MKFQHKPYVIEAEQFFPHEKRWPLNVISMNGGYKVWNDLHKSYISVSPGDWVRTDNPDDTYPIKPEYLEKNYEPIND